MTMVAGCKFHDGAVIIADSRATWEKANGRMFSDNAQKILHLGPKLAIAFAGRVDVAERIVRELRTRLKKDPKSRIPRRCADEFPRIARFYYKKYSKRFKDKKNTVSFVLGGCETMSGVFLWAYNAPDFNPQEIKTGYVVVGSGAVVNSYLSKNYSLINSKVGSLKDKADILFTGLESELQKYEIDTVGGLFQIILLDPGGIRPMTYGFMDLTPDGPGFSKEIQMSKGVWIQKDLIKKTIMKMIEPIKILSTIFPKQDRFHEYEMPKGNRKKLRWYLNYFITCLKTQKDSTATKFIGVLAEIGSFRYPRSVPILASLGFWGPRGDYDLDIYLDNCKDKKLIYKTKIHIEYPSEQYEIDTILNLEILSPGPIFLECLINNTFLARKAIYFGQLTRDSAPKNKVELLDLQKKIREKLIDDHRKCSDPALKDKKCFLDYFVVCQKCSFERGEYVFDGEIRAVFWKKYPLPLKLFIATGFRFSKGKHNLRIDLVNAATRDSFNVSLTVVEGSSECIVTPVTGDFVVKIPEPGIYFLNLYADDEFLSSVVIPAETDQPKYSYSLLEENIKEVSSGGLLILAKRSKSRD